MRTLRLVIEYDGTDFHGWQKQPEVRTVQGCLEQALEQLLGETVRTTAAGRTDAGVHALGQTVSLQAGSSIPVENLARALNAVLPPDVAVVHAEQAVADFNARFNATGKLYRYQIVPSGRRSAFLDRMVWHCPFPLDLDLMREGARGLLGEHDFRAFARDADSNESCVRCLHSVEIRETPPQSIPRGLHEDRDVVSIEVEGDAFLWNMVRSIAGTLVDVGRGKLPPSQVAEIVASGDRSRVGPTLPPQGLALVRVDYTGRPRPHRGPRAGRDQVT